MSSIKEWCSRQIKSYKEKDLARLQAEQNARNDFLNRRREKRKHWDSINQRLAAGNLIPREVFVDEGRFFLRRVRFSDRGAPSVADLVIGQWREDGSLLVNGLTDTHIDIYGARSPDTMIAVLSPHTKVYELNGRTGAHDYKPDVHPSIGQYEFGIIRCIFNMPTGRVFEDVERQFIIDPTGIRLKKPTVLCFPNDTDQFRQEIRVGPLYPGF